MLLQHWHEIKFQKRIVIRFMILCVAIILFLFWLEHIVASDIKNQSRDQAAISIHTQHGVVILHLLNEGFIEMTKSWICNVRRYDGVLAKTVFVVTDQVAYDALATFDKTLNVVFEAYLTPKNLSLIHI